MKDRGLRPGPPGHPAVTLVTSTVPRHSREQDTPPSCARPNVGASLTLTRLPPFAHPGGHTRKTTQDTHGLYFAGVQIVGVPSAARDKGGHEVGGQRTHTLPISTSPKGGRTQLVTHPPPRAATHRNSGECEVGLRGLRAPRVNKAEELLQIPPA